MIKPAHDCLFINNANDTCQHRDLMGVVCTGQCSHYVDDGLEMYAINEPCECHKNSFKPTCKCSLHIAVQNVRERHKRNAHSGGSNLCLKSSLPV